jgi:hypothetical protein
MPLWRFDGRLGATEATGKDEFQGALEFLSSRLAPHQVKVNASQTELVFQLRVEAETREQAGMRAVEEIDAALDEAGLPATKRTWTLTETSNV